jgi:hypothetical protein
MFNRKSHVLLAFFLVNLFLVGLLFVHARVVQQKNRASFLEKRKIVKELQLTDLCIFTDARYTRHPSMADSNTPFQDHPLSLEHFPSGSLMVLPPHLRPQGKD